MERYSTYIKIAILIVLPIAAVLADNHGKRKKMPSVGGQYPPSPLGPPWESGATTVTISHDEVMTVSGKGAMADYNDETPKTIAGYSGEIPWVQWYRWQRKHSSYYPSPVTGLVIDEGVTHIGNKAFNQLEYPTFVTISNSVTSIGSEALPLANLTSINVAADNAHYHSRDNVLFNKDKTVLLLYPRGKQNIAYTIPSGVTIIDDGAFDGCRDLKSVTIPNSVTHIGNQAFANTKLTSITIPNSVTHIGKMAFANTGLTSVIIPNSVNYIGGGAFGRQVSMNIAADNAHYRLEDDILFNKDKTVLLRYSHSKRDTAYTIPPSVTIIEDWAFAGTTLTSITIPNSVISIGNNAFTGTTLTSVTIPNSVTSIGDAAFSYADLKSVTISNSVTAIGDYAFAGCSSLTTITIPNSVTSIGFAAFYYTGLRSVTIPNSVTSIGNAAFYNCDSLTSVTISNGVTSIGSEAFLNTDLTSITIPGSVTSIGGWAFAYNTNLTSATISNGVTSIGDNVFYKTNLTSITIPGSVTSIGNEAFANIYLTSVTISNGVTSIGSGAFYNASLTSVTIPGSVTSIGDEAFANNTGLTSVTIPNGVTAIGNRAFYETNLTSVTIPGSVTSIGDKAFVSVSPRRVASLKVQSPTPPQIGYDAFGHDSRDFTCLYVPAGNIDAYRNAERWKNFVCIEEIPENSKVGTWIALSILTAMILSAAIFGIAFPLYIFPMPAMKKQIHYNG